MIIVWLMEVEMVSHCKGTALKHFDLRNSYRKISKWALWPLSTPGNWDNFYGPSDLFKRAVLWPALRWELKMSSAKTCMPDSHRVIQALLFRMRLTFPIDLRLSIQLRHGGESSSACKIARPPSKNLTFKQFLLTKSENKWIIGFIIGRFWIALWLVKSRPQRALTNHKGGKGNY